MKSSFGRQLLSLMRRNFLIKVRNKSQTAMEFIWPIFFIFLLAMIKNISVADVETAAVRDYPAKLFAYGHEEANQAPLILVAPNTTAVLGVMSQAIGLLQPHYNNSKTMIPFQDADAMDKWFVEQEKNAFGVFAGVVFHGEDIQSYEIRTLYNKSAWTDFLTDVSENCREGSEQCPAETYLNNGFTDLQLAIDSIILSRYGIQAPHYYTQMMPKEKFLGDSTYIRSFAPLFYVYAYSFFLQFLLVNLVTEKKEKMKETMRIMGMKDSAFWCSWIVVYSIIIIFISAFAVVVASFTNFFSEISNVFIFFVLLVLYGLSVINLAFAMTPFFNNPKIAGPIASMSTTAIGILYYAIALSTTYDVDGKPHSPIPSWAQWLLCLFSPIACALGIERGLYLDISQIGMTWENLSFGAEQNDALPMSAHLIMLAVDTMLYFLLALYLDAVVPGEFGTRKHPLFCCMPSYWRSETRSQQDIENLHTEYDASIKRISDIEPISEELKEKNFVRLFDIRKTFHDGDRTIHAVQGISLDMYEGQITCLLGHNGAGKTTLMNMLTGLLPTTQGTATIYGLDISDSNAMGHIRGMTGVCPQANVLVNELTPTEHLRLFAGLKGIPSNETEQAIETSLKDVDLMKKAHTIAKDLSGGQKRKLCVAIALIGDPKIIFLDEPSAGMDPHSRRHLWALLKKKKEGRIILLTTHFMDEADLLSDRKAIVSKGQLRCCGSSIYLKTKFGAGYHLNFVVEPKLFVSERVTELIHRHIPDAQVGHQHAAEVSYTLPYKDVEKFSELFNDIGERQASNNEKLGVQSYGISMTTLEEVFLKLGEEEEAAEEKRALETADSKHRGSFEEKKNEEATESLVPAAQPTLFTGKELSKRQFKTLVKLRFLQIMRNKGAWFGRFMFPILLVVAGMAVIKFTEGPESNVAPPLINVTGSTILNPPRHPVAITNNTEDDISGLLSAISGQWEDGIETFSTDVNLLDYKVHEIGYVISSYVQRGPGINITVQYNSSWRHTMPLLFNTMTNSLLSTVSNNSKVHVAIHPFKTIIPQPDFQGAMFAFSMMVGFALVFIPASFAASVVKDRECNARSQVRISGVSSELYWGSIWLVDLLQGFLLGAIVIVLLLLFQIPSLSTPGALLCTTVFFLLYIPLYMCLAYTLSYLFDKYELATTILPTIFLLMYMIPYMMIAIMIFMPTQGVRDAAKYLHYINVAVNPIYTVSGFFFMLNRLYLLESYVQQTLEPEVTLEHYLEWDYYVVVCYIPVIGWFIVLPLMMRVGEILKYGGSLRELFGSRKTKISDTANSDVIDREDSDVSAERKRVANLSHTAGNMPPVIVVENLRKEFPSSVKGKNKKPLAAVRNATFSVQPGEVFGLLGPNGAGKSTTLNLLTAETSPTVGTVRVGEHDVHSSLSDAYKVMGYCPQYDALWDGITLQEHLEIYATLRGLDKDAAEKIVTSYIKDLCLQQHTYTKANKLSGGTKRKLSFIISMLGNPKIVLLDEPSTGLDPQSKRVFWDTISKSFVGTERGAILTTHYMEEADALCSRIAIMVNGAIECIGTGQHLKSKFGSGYTLEVKLMSPNQAANSVNIDNKIVEIFPSAVSLERFDERIVYRVDHSDVVSLGKAFSQIESAKRRLGILDYSFSQATLEQVFLEFAKQQMGEDDPIDDANNLANLRQKMSESTRSKSAGDKSEIINEMQPLASNQPAHQQLIDNNTAVEFGSADFKLATRESNL